jgi:hypothetical protein
MVGNLEKAWRRAAALAPEHSLALPFAGERVAVIGTGLARGVAQAYAALREDAAHGPTDACEPDDVAPRTYDRTILLSASGDEPALVGAVERLRSEAILAIAVGAPAGSPLDELAGVTVPLADVAGVGGHEAEHALTVFAVLRHHLLGTTGGAVAARGLTAPILDAGGARRWAFVGRRWTLGLAETAARAFRRRGALAVAGTPSALGSGDLGTLDASLACWSFGEVLDVAPAPDDEGPAVRTASLDPVAELVLALRTAAALG